MLERELNEISQAFLEAWTEAFGQEMYYIRFLSESTSSHSVYREATTKVYDTSNKKLFHGSIKQKPLEEQMDIAENTGISTAIITYVSKELIDQGIVFPSLNDIIQYTTYDGRTLTWEIISVQERVQFSDWRIFTKVGVRLV